jgi:pimeloyl-ACP methyl ester carboxylesterase
VKRSFLKWSVIGILVLAVTGAIVVVGGSYVEHRRLVALETDAHPPPGVLVDVGAGTGASADEGAGEGHLHVYAEGDGSPTLVFLSGFGTSSPYFDFKPLFEELSEDYRIAVVERAGYGWSDISSRPRDLETVLGETRAALRRAGEGPPYVLFPHSMAGLEAIYWARNHPEEVEAIIGLDPLVPGHYETTEDGASPSPLITFLARTGLMRSGPDVFARNFPAMVEGQLTQDEAVIAESVFMRRTNTPDMWAEARMLPQNAASFAAGTLPGAAFHAFISGTQPENWKEAVAEYSRATGGEVFVLDAGHYLHVQKPGLIAETSHALIEEARTN